MKVYTARVEVPDSATLEDVVDAQLCAVWHLEEKETKADRMRRTNIEGKCATCRWFVPCITTKAKSYGDCKNWRANISVRYGRSRTQKCKAYERKNT